jgi:hypothetical protein
MQVMKYLGIYILVCTSLYSCAQSKHLIRDAQATYMVHIPGNIATDREGNPINATDTVFTVYIQTAQQDIKWIYARKGGKKYSISKTLIEEPSFEAGINKITGGKIVLKATGNNSWWKLQLLRADSLNMAPLITLPAQIILHGTYHGKKLVEKIERQSEVLAIPSV